MIESTALDFWRKSKKPEIESYIIDHDFRKIQVKNTGSYWILPYIWCLFVVVGTKWMLFTKSIGNNNFMTCVILYFMLYSRTVGV